ncbi:hypothetical protein KM043_003253 [Ampulex compressa]|nr:hypothetical protein KM043_003253 [Ampulex compressa]
MRTSLDAGGRHTMYSRGSLQRTGAFRRTPDEQEVRARDWCCRPATEDENEGEHPGRSPNLFTSSRRSGSRDKKDS